MITSNYSKLKRIFTLVELRKKITFTLLMAIIVRLGVFIPIPGVNVLRLKSLTSKGGLIDFMNMLSGGAFSQASIFTLSIVPYINASIIMYIFTLMFPKLEEMQREGGSEKEKISQWTRYLAIVISIFHSTLTITYLQSNNLISYPGIIFVLNTVAILTASVTFLTWIGDQITSRGIGNGISIIIFLGIVARLPLNIVSAFRQINTDTIINALILGTVCLLLTYIVVIFQLAQRKIPVHYTSGRGSSLLNKGFLPVKMNNAGIMPIIFSSIIISAPASLIKFIPNEYLKSILTNLLNLNNISSLILYFLLVMFFTFFYTSVIFDPEKISENLKKGGGVIPGIRPGIETSKYLDKIISKVTLGGAVFLGFLALLPYIMNKLFGSQSGIGGTGILIAVGVAIEVLQQVDGALSMEDYKRFI